MEPTTATTALPDKCFACGRWLGLNYALVDTRDGQLACVGRVCLRHVLAGGAGGWQPPLGGPRLFPLAQGRPND